MCALPCLMVCCYMNSLSCSWFFGVFVDHTQLTSTTIRQRKDSCMNLLNCCIGNCNELHVQSCHEYCLLESGNVARQRAGDVFLLAFRKSCMHCHVSWSVVSAGGCEFWSLHKIDIVVRHFVVFMVRIGGVVVPRSHAISFRLMPTWIKFVSRLV